MKFMNPIRRITNWYFSRSALPFWCILALDCAAVVIAGYFAFYFNNGGDGVANNFWPLTYGLLAGLVVFVFFFKMFHTFRGVMRYSSFVDLSRVAYANACSCVGLCLLHQAEGYYTFYKYLIFPTVRGAVLIFILATSAMWGLRILVKAVHDTLRSTKRSQKVFVYGCLNGGVAIAKSIRNSRDGRYQLAGFISTERSLEGSWLLGVRVYYDSDDIVGTIRAKDATAILVSPVQSQHFTNRTSLIDALIKADIKIMMMPPAEQWDGKSDLSLQQLREVEIEDLLPRQKIEVDMEAIGSMLRGKRILITGAAGSIGSEMARQVAKFKPSELILIDQAETPMHDMRLWMANYHKDLNCLSVVSSITDQKHMEKIFSEHRPEYVFHAAAYKHVPMMEDNPGQAVRNNIYGTRVIADLAVKYGTKKFVMISTDKAVNPTNVMGCSKRICEIYCQALNSYLHSKSNTNLTNDTNMESKNTDSVNSWNSCSIEKTEFITTRFGNVLGSNGSVIPLFREQIKKGGPVTVTHPDIIRYFMLIPEACRLVLEAGTMGNGGEIFVFDMGDPVKIVDLAERMIALSGAKDVKIEFSGLRDGEKLYEELLATKENTKPTVHPKIMVAEVREYPYEEALRNEEELYELSMSFDDMAIVKKMKEIVPEFKSRQSKFEVLDD